MHKVHEFIHKRQASGKTEKMFWKSTFRVLGLGRHLWVGYQVSGPALRVTGLYRVFGPTYEMGPGSQVPLTVPGLGSYFPEMRFCSYCYLVRVNMKKILKTTKKILSECRRSKKVKSAADSGNTLPQYLSNPKNKFPVKCIFT